MIRYHACAGKVINQRHPTARDAYSDRPFLQLHGNAMARHSRNAALRSSQEAGEGLGELRRTTLADKTDKTPLLPKSTKQRLRHAVDVTRHLGSFTIKPPAAPCISPCFVSCDFPNFWARSLRATLVGLVPPAEWPAPARLVGR